MGKARKGIIKNCEACGIEFYVPQYRAKTAKFCSIECSNHRQWLHHQRKCKGCGGNFEVSNSRSNQKFCSIECRHLIARTAKEEREAKKIDSIKKRGFNGSRQVRNYIFKLKPKICEICSYDDFDFCLDVHHIDENVNNMNLENLMVLCSFCHKKLHKGLIQLIKK